MNDWIEVVAEFDEPPPDWSVFADAFERAGCPSTQVIERPPQMMGCLVDGEAGRRSAEALRTELQRVGALAVGVRTIPNVDWSELWKAHFKPIAVGGKFVIRPTWEPEVENQDGRFEIVLDPGQAFGTGDHPTTRLCLTLLEGVISPETGPILDLGSGSGILAIGAKKLGAKEVLAADIDPIAVEVCRENATINGVEIDCRVASSFDDPHLDREWSVIVSNIISATIIRLAPYAADRMSVGGKWIVSGILESNWSDVRACLEGLGLKLITLQTENGWVGAMWEKPFAAERDRK